MSLGDVMMLAIHWKQSKCKMFLVRNIFFVYSEFRYDQRMDAWRDGPSMNGPRRDLCLVSNGTRLFAIGGFDEEKCVSSFPLTI